jgi:hypothetical protein
MSNEFRHVATSIACSYFSSCIQPHSHFCRQHNYIYQVLAIQLNIPCLEMSYNLIIVGLS